MKDHIRSYWDWRSSSYHSEFSGCAEYELQLWHSIIKPHLPDNNRPLRVLDVGTGPGLLALCLAEHGHEVTAFDISTGMLRAGRETARKKGLSIEWTQGDAENLPMQSGSFDLVTTKYLFWTLSNPARFVHECRRVLASDGILIGIDGNWNRKTFFKTIYSNIFSRFEDQKNQSVHQTFENYYREIRDKLPLYDRSESRLISQLFEDAGFDSIQRQTLKQVRSFHAKKAPISYRLRNPHPPFMISGKVTA